MSTKKTPMRGILLALTMLVFAGACGSSDDETPQAQPGPTAAGRPAAPVKLTVGITGLASNAPLYIAQQKGWFKEENLDIEIKVMGGGALVVPALTNGELQIGSSNLISMMQAYSQGLKLPAVGVTNVGEASPDDKEHLSSAILVPADSPVKSAKDLAGRTVAVNALNSLGDLTIKASIENDGGDPSKVKFTEIQIPAMIPAMQQGRVEAIWTVEPFLTQGVAAGFRPVSYNFLEAMPGLPLGTYNVTESFLKANSPAVEAFTRVMERAARYANENPDEVRAIVPTYTQIPAPVAAKIALPVFAGRLEEPKVEELARLSQKHGLIDKKPDLQALFGRIYS